MRINNKKLEIAMANMCIDRLQLAEKTGLKYPTIRRATQKDGTRPSTIGKLAKALRVEVEDLLED